MPDLISLDTDTTVNNPISLDTGSFNYLLSPETIQNRAVKASYGLSGTPAAKPAGEIAQAITDGQEDQVRSDAAAKINQDNQNKRLGTISNLASQGKLDQSTLDWINSHPSFDSFGLPNSVFESQFANQYTSELDKFANLKGMPSWDVWKDMSDAQVMQLYGWKSTAQREYLITKAQNVQSIINNQAYSDPSVLGPDGKPAFNYGYYGWDIFKTLIPLYNEFKLRGSVPGVSFFDGLLGQNMEDQRTELFNKPWKDFTKIVDDRVDSEIKNGNPLVAAAFLSAMIGQKPYEKGFNSLNTIGALTDTAALGTIAARFGMGVARPIYSAVNLRNQAIRAYTSMLEAQAADPLLTPAGAAAAAGNIPAAGQMRFSSFMDNLANNEITKAALDTLPSFLRADIKNIERDPKNLSTTFLNNLKAQYEARVQFPEKIGNVLRPDRLPLTDATPEQLSLVTNQTLGRYPGWSNAVVWVSDPFREPVSGTHYITAWLGKDSGVFFDSADEAVQFAQAKGVKLTVPDDVLTTLNTRIEALENSIKNIPHNPNKPEQSTLQTSRYFSAQKQLEDLKKQKANLISKGIPEIKTANQNETFSAELGQQGLGYYVKVTVPVNETDGLIRTVLVNPDRPISMTPSLSGGFPPLTSRVGTKVLRSSEETMSREHSMNRTAAVYPQAILLDMLKNEAKAYKAMRRGEKKTFNEVLDFLQDRKDPENKDISGYFFDLDELNHHYLSVYQRLPSEREVNAYFAHKSAVEYDHIIRNVMVHSNQSRWGAETHQVITSAKGADGKPVKSPEFSGRVKDKFPTNTVNVLVVDNDFSKARVKAAERVSVKEKDEWNGKIANGEYKLVENWDPEADTFKDLIGKDTLIHYVLAKNIETAPLKWDQIPFRGGGHIVYDAPKYVKIPVIRVDKVDGNTRVVYIGDRTVAAANFTEDGQVLSDKLNEIGHLLALKREDEARQIYEHHLAGLGPWDEFRKNWNYTKNGSPIYNLELFNKGVKSPFKVVPRNRSTLDLDDSLLNVFGKSFHDGTTESNPAKAFQVQFTGERDAVNLRTVSNRGTAVNPDFNFRPTEKVDPIKITMKSTQAAIHSLFMNDYKTYAVEAWLRDALPHLDNKYRQMAETSPFWVFKNASKDIFKKGTDRNVIGSLLANQFKIDQLVGLPSELDSFLQYGAQKLADSMYEMGAKKLAVVPQVLVPKLDNPFRILRSLTFNVWMGMFYLPQIFVQGMSYINIHALSPLYAPAGTGGALLNIVSKANRSEAMMQALDKIASNLHVPGTSRYRPGEWLEATKVLEESTGFAHVGQEQAQLSSLKDTAVLYNKFQSFLHAGQFPFRAGESSVRLGAWYTAFKEFRDLHPTGALTEGDKLKILKRADDLYGNMSVASHSALNSGVLSLPTQFGNYVLRMSELFWGKRISNADRARLFAYNSLIFGFPSGMGVTGVPFQDQTKQWAFSMGYRPGEHWALDVVMDGLPAFMMQMITGNRYDFGERYGNQGFSNYIATDKTLLGLLGGASGTTLAGFWDDQLKFWHDVVNAPSGTTMLTSDDLFAFINQFQSVNKTRSLLMALNTHKWLNRTGNYIQDVTPSNAAFMYLTGLSPQEQRDAYHVSSLLRAREDLEKEAKKNFESEMAKSLLAASTQDQAAAQAHAKNAISWLITADIPSDQISSLLSKVNSQNISLLDRVSWALYQHAPAKDKEKYGKLYGYFHNYVKGNYQ